MKIEISFTDEGLSEEHNKTLFYTKKNKLYVSNTIDIKLFELVRYYFPKYDTIVYFEHDGLECPDCGCKMSNNGSRRAKPNKLGGIRKEQYICPECSKTKVTSLEPFIRENCNYSLEICEKCLHYDYIGYLSYDKKTEMIKLENGVKMPRQTAYYFESLYDDEFLKIQEKQVMELLKEHGIEASGYYHYDEQFPFKNGIPLVRLSIIDAITQLPINELIIEKKDFDKKVVESFLESSLSNLPREAIITDGAAMYPDIINKIGAKHQLCIFHIIKTHHNKTYPQISKVSRRINTIIKKIAENNKTIKQLQEILKDDDYSQKKKKKTRTRINNLKQTNKELRKERKEKKDELKELLNTNERIENMYNAEDQKGAKRRFNTLNNNKEFLDKNTEIFLGNLGKKVDKSLTYYEDPLIPRTNNNIERYFGITLPRYIKRKYRTVEGLTRWIRLQRIRWIRRNVLHDYNIENISLIQQLQQLN